MAREEILRKIDELENRRFILDMVNRWTSEDYRRADQLDSEISKLKKLL